MDGNRKVVLVGFMGCGKSTVGAALAARLGSEFVDLDTRIETAAGCPIHEIFDRHGEGEFRRIEHAELDRVLAEKHGPGIIAVGGGAFAQPDNIALIERSGALPVWLEAPPAILLERCREQGLDRPLARDPARFARLHAERRPFYERAAARVDAAAPLENVLEQIMGHLFQKE